MNESKNSFSEMLLKLAEEAKEYNKLKVKVKKLHPDAIIGDYAKNGDAGIDLVAISKDYDKDGNVVYGTGLAFEIPYGYVGLLFPRSSNSKKDLYLTNHVGVIDSSYRGEVTLKYRPTDVRMEFEKYSTGNILKSKESIVYDIGDKIGQLIIIPYPQVKLVEVTELSDSDRGTGAYGSTGK